MFSRTTGRFVFTSTHAHDYHYYYCVSYDRNAFLFACKYVHAWDQTSTEVASLRLYAKHESPLRIVCFCLFVHRHSNDHVDLIRMVRMFCISISRGHRWCDQGHDIKQESIGKSVLASVLISMIALLKTHSSAGRQRSDDQISWTIRNWNWAWIRTAFDVIPRSWPYCLMELTNCFYQSSCW